MVFPNSKLPSAAQPWGRFVEKSITNLETLTSVERVNNAARDAQSSLSIKRLDQSVTAVAAATIVAQQAADDAQAAIDGITSLGSIDSPYTINAGNINAGTLTGVTIQSAPSGKRVEITSDRFLIYDSAGSISGRLEGTTVSNEFRLATTSLPDEDGWFGGQRAEILLKPGSVNIDARTGVTYYPPVTISNGSATVPMTLTTGNSTVQLNLAVTGTSAFTGAITSTSTATFNSNVFAPNIPSTTSAANMRWSTSGNGQFFYSTASSARYKEDIVDINTVESIDPKRLLSLPVRGFKYKADYPVDQSDSRYQQVIPGFIAEEVAEHYPLGADYEGDAVESWNERMIVPGMLALIQELYQRIETLEGK